MFNDDNDYSERPADYEDGPDCEEDGPEMGPTFSDDLVWCDAVALLTV